MHIISNKTIVTTIAEMTCHWNSFAKLS